MKHHHFTVRLCLISTLLVGCHQLTGCANLNNTQNGTLLGSLAGAGAGAIVGHQTGNRDKGALIGALAGAAGGGLLGNAQDETEKHEAAVEFARQTESNRRADIMAVTNRDIVEMTQQGFSDQHIINTIQHRGGRFDTSPSAQGEMKQRGVSEKVLTSMMGMAR